MPESAIQPQPQLESESESESSPRLESESSPRFQSGRPRLLLVTGSSRPGRVGPVVTGWFAEHARRDGRFDLVDADLGLLNLPLLDEPEHASEHRYVHGHTRRWSELVASADAIVLVTPEYNRSFPAPLKNALDYLYDEWRDKPVGFVGYGMTSMGLRAIEALIPVVTALKMLPIAEAVCVPLRQALAEDGNLQPTPSMEPAATSLLDELHRITALLGARAEGSIHPTVSGKVTHSPEIGSSRVDETSNMVKSFSALS